MKNGWSKPLHGTGTADALHSQHTSASLLIQENADPDVRRDLEAFFQRLGAGRRSAFCTHTIEGDDDMPAHVRTALTAVNLGIPVRGGRLVLGTWQGIYVWEHRVRGDTPAASRCISANSRAGGGASACRAAAWRKTTSCTRSRNQFQRSGSTGVLRPTWPIYQAKKLRQARARMARCGTSLCKLSNLSRHYVLAALYILLFPCHARRERHKHLPLTGPEIFPMTIKSACLHAADLDGDGLNDLIVVNNLHSKINLLYNQTGKTNLAAAANPPQPLDINQLPPDARFRIDSIPADEHIAAMVVTDLNGDGRPDIAFYGDSKDLEVIYNQGTNGWSEPKRWHIEDGQMNPNALAEGDLNGDGRTDLVLLGDNGSLYFLPQLPDHTLGEPQKIPYSGTPKAVQIIDVNGDGRKDLLLVDWDSPTPFRFRLQNATGQLGPEIYFKTQPIRSYCADNLEGDAKTYIVTLAQNSGRAEISQFVRKPAEVLSGAFRQGQFQILPLRKAEGHNAVCFGLMSMAMAGRICSLPNRTAARFPFICSNRTVHWPSRIHFRHWPV